MPFLQRSGLCTARTMRVGLMRTTTKWGGYTYPSDIPPEKGATELNEQIDPASVTEKQELKDLHNPKKIQQKDDNRPDKPE